MRYKILDKLLPNVIFVVIKNSFQTAQSITYTKINMTTIFTVLYPTLVAIMHGNSSTSTCNKLLQCTLTDFAVMM